MAAHIPHMRIPSFHPVGGGLNPHMGGIRGKMPGGLTGLHGMAGGGMTAPAMRALVARNSEPPKEPMHVGKLPLPVSGRTDHIMSSVPAGSYVIPADVVNQYGQDNTRAGETVLDRLFKGSKIQALRNMSGRNADGRNAIPVALAGGEYVVPPESVSRIGNGDMKRGHAILDHFVRMSREHHIKTLKKLPGPKKGEK